MHHGGAEIYIDRAEARSRVYGTVLYAIEMSGGQPDQFMTGMLRDLSGSGACLYLQKRYARGEQLRVTSSSFGLSRQAEVMWSEKVDDGLYKTGVRFTTGR